MHLDGSTSTSLAGPPGQSTARPPRADAAEKTATQSELSEQEQRQVEKLKQRDREVRAHEAAHQGAGGGLAGGANFTYSQGPDGRRYATGGEVSIDTSAVPGDPQATLRKAQTVRQAALAPAEPSAQDQQVAAEAATMATQARQQIARERQEGSSDPATSEESSDLQRRIQAGGALENDDQAGHSSLHLQA